MSPVPSPTPPLPPPIREQIRDEWEAAASEWARRDLWAQVEDAAQSVNDHLVRLAHVGPGDRVLDVGTGIGEPAATAARKVGSSGSVLGIDLAPTMVEEGRKRMRRLGLDSVVELRCGDAEDLHLDAASFDAVLSRWALMLAADFRATLAGLHRLLGPGGHLAIALWGSPDRVPFIRLAMEAAMELAGSAAPPPGQGPQHFWTRGVEALERLGSEAGFDDVHSEVFEVTFEFPSAHDYADFICRMAGPIKVLTERLPDLSREELLDEVAERARSHVQADGSVRLVNENLILYGLRSAS